MVTKLLNDLKNTASLDMIVRNTNKNFRIKQAKKNRQNDILTYRKQRKLFPHHEYLENIKRIKENYRSERQLISNNYNETIKLINEDKIIMSLNLTGFYSKSSKKYVHINLSKPVILTTSTTLKIRLSLIKRIGIRNFLILKK